jgi:hypothetical protein
MVTNLCRLTSSTRLKPRRPNEKLSETFLIISQEVNNLAYARLQVAALDAGLDSCARSWHKL